MRGRAVVVREFSLTCLPAARLPSHLPSHGRTNRAPIPSACPLLFSCRESRITSGGLLPKLNDVLPLSSCPRTTGCTFRPRATRRSLLPTRLLLAYPKFGFTNCSLSESPATCLQSPAHTLLYPRRQPCLVRRPRPYGGILGIRKAGISPAR